MRRYVRELSPLQTDPDDPFEVTFTPRPFDLWHITAIVVSVPNFKAGQVNALVFIDEQFVCGSSQGQLDSADGSPLDVLDNMKLTVRWEPSGFLTLCHGQARLYLDSGTGR